MCLILASSISNQLSARLYANLQDSRLEQDMHELFTPSDRQFNTLGVHNIPAPQVLAFFSSIWPKTVVYGINYRPSTSFIIHSLTCVQYIDYCPV